MKLSLRLINLLIDALVPILIGSSTIFLLVHQHEVMMRNFEQDQRISEDQLRQDRLIRQLDREEDLKILDLRRRQDLENAELQRQLDRSIAENESETRRKIERQYRELSEEQRRKDFEIFVKNQLEDEKREGERRLDRLMLDYVNDVSAVIFRYGLETVLQSRELSLEILRRTQLVMHSLDASRRAFLFFLLVETPLNPHTFSQSHVSIFSSCDLRETEFSPTMFNDLNFPHVLDGPFRVGRSIFDGSSFQSLIFSAIEIDVTETIFDESFWLDIEFSGVKIFGARMPGVNFQRLTLQSVVFERTDLRRASFRLVRTAFGVEFRSLRMSSADFSGNSWKDFFFFRLNAFQTNFSDSQFFDGQFRSADLRQANLSNSKFTNVTFILMTMDQCEMKNTSFIGSTFTDTNFTSCRDFKTAKFIKTRFIRSTLPNGTWTERFCFNCS